MDSLKSTAIIFGLVLLHSCAVTDHTDSIHMNHLVGSKFELRLDSFVYKSECGGVDQLLPTFVPCNVIQVAGGNCLPKSNEAYKADREKAITVLKKCMQKEWGTWYAVDDAAIVAHIPKGSTLTITRVVEIPMASNRYWIMRAIVQSGEMTELEVSLSNHYTFPPYWYRPLHVFQGVPYVKKRFLKLKI